MTHVTHLALFLMGELVATLRANDSALFMQCVAGGIQNMGEEPVEEQLLEGTTGL